MTPEEIAKVSESSHQKALFAWAAGKEIQTLYPELKYMFAIPNGGYRNKIEAAKLRAEGVKAGVPDIFLPAPRGKWYGLFIEMKAPAVMVGEKRKRAGEKTPAQKLMIPNLQSLGYGVATCVGWEQARDTILQYLEWKE